MVLAPATAASSAAISLKHDTSMIDYSANVQGCAKATNTVHKFSLLTGTGQASMKATATTCGPVKGGYTVNSYGNSYTELGVSQSFASLAHNYSSLNSSWNISAVLSLSAAGTIKHCPYQTISEMISGYNGTGFANGWLNETYQQCYAEAYVNLDPEEQVYDQTTGQNWGFGFSGYYVTAGSYAENYTETINYTTVGWTNSTYSCTTCWGSFGAGGTTAVNTNIYGNVTASTYGLSWSKGDKVTISAEVFVEVGVELYYAKAGTASASLVATAPRGHVDLTSFTFA
jgi:hypothetical protein